MNKEKVFIVILSVGFLIISVLYITSLITIQNIYKSSAVSSLEFQADKSQITIESGSEINDDETDNISLPITTVPRPSPIDSPVDQTCHVGGCSGQLCGDISVLDIATTCEWIEEYACYTKTKCERQRDGKCGWTENKELSLCLLEVSGQNGGLIQNM